MARCDRAVYAIRRGGKSSLGDGGGKHRVYGKEWRSGNVSGRGVLVYVCGHSASIERDLGLHSGCAVGLRIKRVEHGHMLQSNVVPYDFVHLRPKHQRLHDSSGVALTMAYEEALKPRRYDLRLKFPFCTSFQRLFVDAFQLSRLTRAGR